jgi:hypothetical protein
MHKFILLIALWLLPFGMIGQEQPADSLPPLNQKMLTFAQKGLGQQFGRGICSEFVSAAMKHTTGASFWRPDYQLDLRNELIRPGDVLYMSWYKRKRKFQSHVAIVVEVLERHRVRVAHQNFNNQKFVTEATYDLRQEIRNGRTVKVYRAVSQEQ